MSQDRDISAKPALLTRNVTSGAAFTAASHLGGIGHVQREIARNTEELAINCGI
jgi:hypothetical protein